MPLHIKFNGGRPKINKISWVPLLEVGLYDVEVVLSLGT